MKKEELDKVEIRRIEADTENIKVRTQACKMETARRNVEVLSKCDIGSSLQESKQKAIKNNLAILENI